MSLASMQSELARIERKRQDLERRIKAQLATRISSLPSSVGLRSVDSLIVALVPYASQALRARMKLDNLPPPVVEPAPAGANGYATGQRGKRYPPPVKARVKAAFNEGIKTLGDVSREEGISMATLTKWRREWGMVRSRVGAKAMVNGASAS